MKDTLKKKLKKKKKKKKNLRDLVWDTHNDR